MEEIIFESIDIEIFNIPDTKTKLNTLQNYFFPRLKHLVDSALLLVREVYKIDPFEKYSFVYRPSHRKDAKNNVDFNEVHIGISGRRDRQKQLKLKRSDGKNYAFHPSYLYFKVLPTGVIFVELWPFSHSDEAYISRVKHFLAQHYNIFSSLLNAGKISFEDGHDLTIAFNHLSSQRPFGSIENDDKGEEVFWLSSSEHYFPITNQRVIGSLVLSFLFLFPILDACHDLAEGATPTLSIHFDNLKTWLNEESTQEVDDVVPPEPSSLQLPELDSYRFIRAGLWYQVLARDNWTCCSCRRTAKAHGIVLHVDHILPRSKGGKDESDNLQTLCLKCNIGKSNKDMTDLR